MTQTRDRNSNCQDIFVRLYPFKSFLLSQIISEETFSFSDCEQELPRTQISFGGEKQETEHKQGIEIRVLK